jgi:hypothetical protein
VEQRSCCVGVGAHLDLPDNLALPFFAYGLLKPSEPGHRRVAALTGTSEDARAVGRSLRIRDGLPLLVADPERYVVGVLLHPSHGAETAFYKAVRSFEPAKQYRGIVPIEVMTATGPRAANTLEARRPESGAEPYDDSEWSASVDPMLVEGLTVVSQTAGRLLSDGWLIGLQQRGSPPTAELFDRFFQLQAAYLLLWTIAERVAAFAVGPDAGATARLRDLERLPEYRKAFDKARVIPGRRVTDVRDPGDEVSLSDGGKGALSKYWYTIRSTVAHRGKAAFRDVELVALAVIGLHDVLRHPVPDLWPSVAQAWADREPDGLATWWSLRRRCLGE